MWGFWVLGFWVSGFGFRVLGFGFRVSGCGALDFGFRVSGSSSSSLSSLELGDTQVYEPYTRALLGTASHVCDVVAPGFGFRHLELGVDRREQLPLVKG